MPPTYCYVDTYLATQDRLLAMDIDLLCLRALAAAARSGRGGVCQREPQLLSACGTHAA